MHEVESQTIGCHERARLLHVRAQHLSQCGVKQVGGGVVAARGVARRRIDFGGDQIALGSVP